MHSAKLASDFQETLLTAHGSKLIPCATKGLTMKTETNSDNALAVTGQTDLFRTYADACAPRMIVGKLLKFSKGDFVLGDAGETIADDAEFTVLMDELTVGWVRWEDDKVAETRMGRVIDGFAPQPRRELGDVDAAAWETAADGKARDPWQFQNYLPLERGDGELLTFVASSRGALNAIAELCRIHSRHAKQHPNVYPVIRLRSDEYQHRVKEFGRIKFPVLSVVGWTTKTDLPEQARPTDDPLEDYLPY